ncbi:hypothetical protein PtB15_3B92 [Puccinia triticina]|nr:hypothetical protein PtB15_3B92 [Puccinia triticina]
MQSKLLPILVLLFCHLNWSLGSPVPDSTAVASEVDNLRTDLSATKAADPARNGFDKEEEKTPLISKTKPLSDGSHASGSKSMLTEEEQPLLENSQSEHSSSKPPEHTPDQLELAKDAKDGKKPSLLAKLKQCLVNWYYGDSFVARFSRGLRAYFSLEKLRNKDEDAKKAEEVAKGAQATSKAKEDAKPEHILAPVSEQKEPPQPATTSESPPVHEASTDTAKPSANSDASTVNGVAGK